MNLQECYKFLGVSKSSSKDEVTRSFKKLANKYHPDKNRDRIKWATNAMTNINVAYTTIMGYRFEDSSEIAGDEPLHKDKQKKQDSYRGRDAGMRGEAEQKEFNEVYERDVLINSFVKLRESAKDALYRYFQYGLYNLNLREKRSKQRLFDKIVDDLRKSYHSLIKFPDFTRDDEIIEHTSTFGDMIFNFYKASECLNILDSYSSRVDVDAYRQYKKGDELLHIAHKEVFYERHNRGHYRKEITVPNLLDAEAFFRGTLKSYPDSSWSVETGIKLEYVLSLKNYLLLFFTK